MPVRLPRIRGSETEYGLAVWVNGKQIVSFLSDVAKHTMFREFLPATLIMVGSEVSGDSAGYLDNGGRLYIDTGFHPEYATPEGLFAVDIVAYEKSGDYILEEVVRRANEAWKKEGIVSRVFKNNVATKDPDENDSSSAQDIGEIFYGLDKKEKTYGNHQNYLLQRRDDLVHEKLIAPLGLFLATCQLFTGSGKFWLDKHGKIRFRISQRAPHIKHNVSGATTSERALINTRDESHGPADKRRLHLIASDSNLAEVAIFLKFATTALLLDMLEAGWAEKMPTLGSSYPYWRLMQKFADDSSLTTAERIGGKSHSIVDVQELYYLLAKKFCSEDTCDNEGIKKEREMALQLWERIIDCSRPPRPHEALSRLLDWAAKKLVAEQDVEKRGLTLQSAPHLPVLRKGSRKTESVTLIQHLCEIDQRYHMLDPKGLWKKLNAENYFERVVSDEEIIFRVFHPIPESTRACARAEEVRYSKNPGVKLGSPGWTRPVLKWDPPPDPNPYLDPYDWKPKHPLLKNSG